MPVTVKTRKGEVVIAKDEEPSKIDLNKIPELRAAFGKDGVLTAASSSKISDGAAAVVLLSWFILRKTILGLHIYAVGGNPTAARLTGIKVSSILLFVYAINGLFSGIAGAMSSSRLYAANGNWGTGYELDAIAAVVLGGTSLMGGVGSIWGTVIGALIIGVMNNGLTILGLSSFWQYVAKGVVIILAVLLDKWRQQQNAGN